MKVIYQNKTGRNIRMTLPDRTSVSFPQEDTIHLCISRKYAQHYLDALLAESGVCKLAGYLDFGGAHNSMPFGMDLLVLSGASGCARSKQSIAEDIWRI